MVAVVAAACGDDYCDYYDCCADGFDSKDEGGSDDSYLILSFGSWNDWDQVNRIHDDFHLLSHSQNVYAFVCFPVPSFDIAVLVVAVSVVVVASAAVQDPSPFFSVCAFD